MNFGGGFWGLCSLDPLTQDQIRTMPMLYRADEDFAAKNCPQLRGFLSAIETSYPNRYDAYDYGSIDVKVAMLKPGWWPCIPGWHLDDFWRSAETGQPDLDELKNHQSMHLMALFGDASLTEFIKGRIELPNPPKSSITYGFYDKLLKNLNLETEVLKENILYRFGSYDFHRGMPATKSGWRAFIRATFSNHRQPKNEIRQQVNIYVPTDELTKGW